jgi:hypothetical protein
MSNPDDFGSDDDLPPDDCGFTVDKAGGLHCPKAESGECAECPVGREFNIEDINP